MYKYLAGKIGSVLVIVREPGERRSMVRDQSSTKKDNERSVGIGNGSRSKEQGARSKDQGSR